ncbi:MAG: hypothetical protein E6Q33_10365 [Neisseriales bacterium]|nr:MAG: hypothetical protein E6Q33_10365 [Neisseriales bacterium]
MIFFTSKVPLIMDPNNQAIEWLKREKDKMEVINQRNSKFTNTL